MRFRHRRFNTGSLVLAMLCAAREKGGELRFCGWVACICVCTYVHVFVCECACLRCSRFVHAAVPEMVWKGMLCSIHNAHRLFDGQVPLLPSCHLRILSCLMSCITHDRCVCMRRQRAHFRSHLSSTRFRSGLAAARH